MGIVEPLVPDELWALFQRVVPKAPSRPQGGGRRRHGDREVLAAIVFVATSGCTWQQLPAASFATGQRRSVGRGRSPYGHDPKGSVNEPRRAIRSRQVTERKSSTEVGPEPEFGRHGDSCQDSIAVLLVRGAGHAPDEGRLV
ncbi:transposase [Streptomyces sp. NBC_00440]|uniref:transposase n=1 Tax=unclassified Streptomyces TaxID=2593676 RepID=UPI002E1A509F